MYEQAHINLAEVLRSSQGAHHVGWVSPSKSASMMHISTQLRYLHTEAPGVWLGSGKADLWEDTFYLNPVNNEAMYTKCVAPTQCPGKWGKPMELLDMCSGFPLPHSPHSRWVGRHQTKLTMVIREEVRTAAAQTLTHLGFKLTHPRDLGASRGLATDRGAWKTCPFTYIHTWPVSLCAHWCWSVKCL